MDYCITNSSTKATGKKFPISSLDHISREVIDIDNSTYFYVEIMGFTIIPRPPLDCEGCWLYGYGISLHLIKTIVPKERNIIKMNRIKHFCGYLPTVDHIAFITSDITFIKNILDDSGVFYKEFPINIAGIQQIFIFDPDYNVIEISTANIPTKPSSIKVVPDALDKNMAYLYLLLLLYCPVFIKLFLQYRSYWNT